MSTYEEICKQRCPNGCGANGSRKFTTPASFTYHVSGGIDDGEGISGGHKFECTAPTPDQVIEEQAAEIGRLRGLIGKLKHQIGCPNHLPDGWQFTTRKRDREPCNCIKSKAVKS